MKKSTCFLALAVLLGLNHMPIMAEPGDLLQTFLNPRPSTDRPSGNFWVRCPVAAVGKNLVVGFPFDDAFGTDAGIAYLFDTSTGKVLRTFKSPGPVAGAQFGSSVAAVGNRVLICAYHESPPDRPKRAGAAYIFDSSTGELLHTLQKPSPAVGDYFGNPVGVLGNNFLVSCRWDDTGAKDAGAVFLYESATGELLQVFRNPEPRANQGFGGPLAAVGDNLLVGETKDDTKGPNAGAAYLFDGATGQLLQTFYNPEPGRKNGFGFAVAALGNNVLIVDKSFQPTRADGGVVYLFDSVTGELLQTFHNPAPAIDDGFGHSIAAVAGNVLVSANHANLNGFNAGAAFLFDGSTGELLHTFFNPTPAWNDHFALTVATLGNNIVIAAPFDDVAGIDAGAVYLFEGGSSAEFKTSGPPVTMTKTSTTRLYVRTTPPGARVLLDRRPIGISNGLFTVPPGDHKITLEMAGYETQTLPVKVAESQITRLQAQLKRSSR